MESVILKWTPLIEFSEENINNIVEKLSGAYRLSYKDESDNNYYVFYVGDTTDIKNTLLNHLKDENKTCIALLVKTKKCAFRYSEIKEEQLRKSTTKQAYEHYKPSCNEIDPEGDINITVNLS
jgi:hypothetical protein